jgi:3',5'-cyclic AMP phosphodiesterase CpdA
MNPDLVIITGDLTAQAIPAEFVKARAALEPILSKFATFVIPGNHDMYTWGAYRSRRIERYFAPWMGLDAHRPVGRLDLGEITVLGLDPNRPGMAGSGELPQAQLTRLAEMLEDPSLSGRYVVLAVHYPIVNARGEPYDGWGHGLRNARALIDVLDRAQKRPDLVLHGHKHQGHHAQITLTDRRQIEVFNPGSSGYVYDLDAKRAAAVNEYVIDEGHLVRFERHMYDGRHFVLESGGAYATGW